MVFQYHDDVIKWKHFPRYWPFVRGIHRWPVNSPHKGQWCGAVMCSFICAWINGWVNDREPGDFRRHRAHYGVTLVIYTEAWTCYSIVYRQRKYIILNKMYCLLIQILLMLVPKDFIYNKAAQAKVIAWHQTGDRPLLQSMINQIKDGFFVAVTRTWIQQN